MQGKKILMICIAGVLIVGSFDVWYFGKDKLSNDVPQIKITAEKREIKHIGKLTQPNSAVDRNGFSPALNAVKMQDIPYLKTGAKLEIEFLNQAPKDVRLKNYLLSSDGSIKYTEKEAQETPIQISGKTASFLLRANPASALSSNIHDYESGAVLRGFLLSCRYQDGRECNYTFLIRSDAL